MTNQSFLKPKTLLDYRVRAEAQFIADLIPDGYEFDYNYLIDIFYQIFSVYETKDLDFNDITFKNHKVSHEDFDKNDSNFYTDDDVLVLDFNQIKQKPSIIKILNIDFDYIPYNTGEKYEIIFAEESRETAKEGGDVKLQRRKVEDSNMKNLDLPIEYWYNMRMTFLPKNNL